MHHLALAIWASEQQNLQEEISKKTVETKEALDQQPDLRHLCSIFC